MKRLDRYIAEQLWQAVLLVVVVLSGIQVFMELLRHLNDIGVGSYGLAAVFVTVIFQLPLDIYQLFPMAGFLGCLLGLGRLASHSELIAMRAGAFSIGQILGAVLKAAALLIILVTLMGETLAPWLQGESEHLRQIAMSRAFGESKQGIWLREGKNFIYLDTVHGEQANDITFFQVEPTGAMGLAAHAATATHPEKRLWVLHEGETTHFQNAYLTLTHFAQHPLPLLYDPRLEQEGKRAADDLSVTKLYESIQYRVGAKLNASRLTVAFWQRIMQPLTTLVMIALGVPFIFGSLRNAST